MSWNRTPVAGALVAMLGPAAGGVKVHERPPETVNPMCVVIDRPQTVLFSTVAPGIDEATLPVILVGGVETEDALEAIKTACKTAVLADPTLKGTVQAAWPAEERNWRNMTGAGGIQLLTVELILTIQM
jgi:hypothetical protein